MRCSDALGRGFVALLLLGLALPFAGSQTLTMEFQDKPTSPSWTFCRLWVISRADPSYPTIPLRDGFYYFAEMEFDRALEVFLKTYKLYYNLDNGIYYVSRIRSSADTSNGTISIDSEEVDIRSASQRGPRDWQAL